MTETTQFCPELWYAALFCVLSVCLIPTYLLHASLLPGPFWLPLALASSLPPCPLLQPEVSATGLQNLIVGSTMYASVYMEVEQWRIKWDKTTSHFPYHGHPGCYDQATPHGGRNSVPRCLPPHRRHCQVEAP